MRKKKFSITQLILTVFMLLLTLTMIVPLLHILARSLSDPLQSAGMSSLEVIPRGFSLINYQVLFSNKTLVPSIFNSIFITVVGTFLNIVLTALAAYVLTRPGLVGKRVLMLFDPGIVPEYMTVKKIGLMGSQWSVILCMAVNVYYLVIMMRYFEDVPVSLCEAAKIDGAGHLRVLFSVVLPLAKPGIATITMLSAMGFWNEYPLALVLLTDDAQKTLPIGMANLFEVQKYATDWGALFAGLVIIMIPTMIIYLIGQRYLLQGIGAGGLKG